MDNKEMVTRIVKSLEMGYNYYNSKLTIESSGSCEYCPFDAKTVENPNEIYNDPSEAHYICPLLNKTIWGEEPECSEAMTKLILDYLKCTTF
jgi:hypothetical protein